MNREAVRAKMVARAERMLRRADQPRFQMSLIVAVTSGVGFVASYGLLDAGLTSMAIRYPLAIAFAYLSFLGLLRLWLRYQGQRFVRSCNPDPSSIDIGGGDGTATPDVFAGEGGHLAVAVRQRLSMRQRRRVSQRASRRISQRGTVVDRTVEGFHLT